MNQNITAFDLINNLLRWTRLDVYDDISHHIKAYRCANYIAYMIPRFISPYASGELLYSSQNSRILVASKLLSSLPVNSEYHLLNNTFGIYFLYNQDDFSIKQSDIPIYIGQTSNGFERILQHITSSAPKTDTKYYKSWDTALYITSTTSSWNSAVIDDLERYFIKIFKDNSAVYTTYKTQRDGQRGTSTSLNDLHRSYATEIVAISNLLSHPDINHPLVISDSKLQQQLSDESDTFKNTAPSDTQAIKEINGQSKKKNIYSNSLSFIERRNTYCNIKHLTSRGDLYVLQSNRILVNGGRSDEIVTPLELAREMVSRIPSRYFNSTSKFLDPACKSGSFLIAIIERFMSDDPNLPINNDPTYRNKIKRLDNLLQNQLYACCIVGESWFVANNAIMKYTEDLYINLRRESDEIVYAVPKVTCIPAYSPIVRYIEPSLVNQVINIDFGEDITMKFDVIVGNPPYNDDLYINFSELATYITKEGGFFEFITPAKWQSKSTPRNLDFNQHITPLIDSIVYYPDTKEVFDTVSLSGGISIYTSDMKAHDTKRVTCIRGGKEYLKYTGILQYQLDITKEELSIISKVLSKQEPCFTDDPNCCIVERITAKYNGSPVSSTQLPYIKQQGSGVYFVSTKERAEINPYSVSKPEHLGHYHLCCSNWMRNRPSFGILNKNEVGIYGFMFPYRSESLGVIKSAKSYLETRLIWFLIYRLHQGSPLNERCLKYTPMIPDTTITYTDNYMYTKYNLTPAEIQCLERTIPSPGSLGLQ